MLSAHIKRRMGNVLKTARLGTGLTQQQVADRLGCDQSAISRYEQGKADVSKELAPKYAELLKIDVLSVLYARQGKAA